MGHFLKVTFLLVCCSGIALSGNPPSNAKLTTVPSYKKYKTDHFSILFSGVEYTSIEPIGAFAESFLDELMGQWKIDLKKAHFNLLITKSKLSGRTNSGYRMGDAMGVVNMNSHSETEIEENIKRAVVLCVLNKRVTALPVFLQQGISLYFSDLHVDAPELQAMFAFSKYPMTLSFINGAESQIKDPFSFDALSLLFVTYLWEQSREKTISFLQHFLNGNALDHCFTNSEFGSYNNMLDDFQRWGKRNYRIENIYRFSAFWKLLFVCICFGLFLYHIQSAWRKSGLTIVELATTKSNSMEDVVFSGPAFLGTTDLNMGTELKERAGLPVNQSVSALPEKLEKAKEAIELDLDQFFSKVGEDETKPNQPVNEPVQKSEKGDDIDQQIDDILNF